MLSNAPLSILLSGLMIVMVFVCSSADMKSFIVLPFTIRHTSKLSPLHCANPDWQRSKTLLRLLDIPLLPNDAGKNSTPNSAVRPLLPNPIPADVPASTSLSMHWSDVGFWNTSLRPKSPDVLASMKPQCAASSAAWACHGPLLLPLCFLLRFSTLPKTKPPLRHLFPLPQKFRLHLFCHLAVVLAPLQLSRPSRSHCPRTTRRQRHRRRKPPAPFPWALRSILLSALLPCILFDFLSSCSALSI